MRQNEPRGAMEEPMETQSGQALVSCLQCLQYASIVIISEHLYSTSSRNVREAPRMATQRL